MSEEVLYEAHPSMFRDRPLGFILSVLLIAAFGIGLIILLVWWLRSLSWKLTVSDERVTLRRGLLSKHTNEVFHTDIRNVQIDQNLQQRLFGAGDIAISSAGQSDVEIAIRGIPHPERVKEIIDEHRREGR